MYHFKACGLDNVFLKNGYQITNSASGSGVSIDELDTLLSAIAMRIVESERPIQAAEFKYLRLELDLTQETLGKLLDKSGQSIALFEKGKQPIPRLVDVALRNYYCESKG